LFYGIVGEDRWLLFNDDLGVSGASPYYQVTRGRMCSLLIECVLFNDDLGVPGASPYYQVMAPLH